MTLRAQFTPISPEFDGFLFAVIGEEENGASLSVLSAFSRLDLDPWREGARLAGLPRAAAAQALAPIIARLSTGKWERAEIPAIASRLVQLLPVGDVPPPRSQAAAADAATKEAQLTVWLVRGACVVLLGLALLGVLLPGADGVDTPPSFTVSTPAPPR